MGFGREAARLFKGLYDNVLWTIDPTNEASKKVAAYIGLTHNATLYLKDRSWKHTPWGHDRELEIWSN
jgi:RimJ/RimL family protein N-acetyltransferase